MKKITCNLVATLLFAVAMQAQGDARADFPVKAGYVSTLRNGTYTTWGSVTYLQWASGQTLPDAIEYRKDANGNNLPVSGVSVGTGECVALRRLTDAPPLDPTGTGANNGWKAGKRVMDGGLTQPVLIASFKKDGSGVLRYNGHACLFSAYVTPARGFEAWSQRWPASFRAISRHTVFGSYTGTGSVLDPSTYYVVERP